MLYDHSNRTSPQECRDIIRKIIARAQEKFGLNITITPDLSAPIGGGMDGQNFLLCSRLEERDPEYALYATIHAGLGHNYQLGDSDHPLYLMYAVSPAQHPSQEAIKQIRNIEAEATAFGAAMVKQLLPDSKFIRKINTFSAYWFTQDWSQLQRYYEGGAPPIYGTRLDFEKNEIFHLPRVTLHKDFRSKGAVFNEPIYFHAQAANDNFYGGAVLEPKRGGGSVSNPPSP